MTKVNLAAIVQAKEISPYIYFIKKGYLLYIGETQKNPVMRWSEHLSEEGSFRQAVIRVDEEVLKIDSLIYFYAYHCSAIEEDVSIVERRRATQYVEHQLHTRIVSKGIPSESEIRIISNTVRTAPLGYKYSWLNASVDSIYEMFINDLANFRLNERL
jgi:hypothetical protein